ncbi:hypothetical protein Scep_002055 [Stephania cephalantha]|uniref:Uncharacterized protein n=1 Tax=Stephania cephalantha TaxID=152367 RepID=A0AAP0LD26_9MAGN
MMAEAMTDQWGASKGSSAGGEDRPAGGYQRATMAIRASGRRPPTQPGSEQQREQEAIRAGGQRRRECNQPLRRGVLALNFQRPAGYGPRRTTDDRASLRRTGRWIAGER